MCKRKLSYYDLKTLLAHNVVKLEFRKVCGTVVVRTGTRNMEKIESLIGEQAFSGTGYVGHHEIVPFFDIEDEKWKSLVFDRLLNYTILERLNNDV